MAEKKESITKKGKKISHSKETMIKTQSLKPVVHKPVQTAAVNIDRFAKSSKEKSVSVDRILVENFASLQKVMTNFALKFERLSEQMSKLLELFEISAKSLAEKGYPDEGDKKMMEKLDSLLEHNKIIAKGIALLHERGESEPVEEEIYEPEEKKYLPKQEYMEEPPRKLPAALPESSMPVPKFSMKEPESKNMQNIPKPLPVPKPASNIGA